jgi:TatD DNase family protein
MRAIGEVGLDLHWDASRLEEQRRVLKAQMEWSDRFGLPLLLHIRDAMPQWLELLAEWRTTHQAPLRGIMHCYSGTAEQAFEILQSGTFYFGIGGTLTYKKSLVPDVARAIGLEHLVVETDAPYLAPVPHRGQRNEPSFVADTASALATIFGTTIEEVARITTENAQKLFAK